MSTQLIRIAIAEDENECAEKLESFIHRYVQENGLQAQVTRFEDGLELVEAYNAQWDILFLDIQMRHVDGMAAARKIRKQDTEVLIVFITNLARYALQGYEVDAADFILKPLRYDRFCVRMDKLAALIGRRQDVSVVLPLPDRKVKVSAAEILYAEVYDHDLRVVTARENYILRYSLQELEKALEGQPFSRPNRSTLVNLRHVTAVEKDSLRIGGQEIVFSRPRKKAFLQDFSDYLGGAL